MHVGLLTPGQHFLDFLEQRLHGRRGQEDVVDELVEAVDAVHHLVADLAPVVRGGIQAHRGAEEAEPADGGQEGGEVLAPGVQGQLEVAGLRVQGREELHAGVNPLKNVRC